jgi:flagellar protein FlaJ
MKAAYKLFGKSFKEQRSRYAYFEKLLKSARIPKPYDVYLAEAKFYSLIAGLIGLVLGFILYNLVVVHIIAKLTKRYEAQAPTLPVSSPFHVHHIKLPLTGGGIEFNIPNVIIAILFSLFSFIALYYLTFSIFRLYPSMKADDRRRNINRMLPYAVNYMYTLSKGGVGIIQIVQALSKHKDIYGEVANEFAFVVNLMEYFGYDFHTAMMELYEITPSDTMKEFIAGLITTIDSGGDITVYLAHKCEQYVEKSKSEQKSFIETLGLLAESYVTIAVTAPLFIIILQSVMLVIGSGDIKDLYGVIYLLIPASSIMFAFLIHFISPKEMRKAKIEEITKVKEDTRGLFVDEDKEIYERFMKAKKKKESIEKLKSPIKIIKERPPYVLAISGPVSLIYILLFLKTLRPDILLVTSVIIAIIPLAIFHEMKKRRERIIKEQIPEMLKGLASVTATGATLQQAIEIVAESGKGYLFDEVKRMKRSIEWGMDLVEAFRDMARNLKIPSLTRVVTILTDVLTIGGDITETLHVCSKDAELERSLARERRFSMFIYIIIIYVAFFTFLGIMIVLFTKLFPKFFEMTSSTTTAGFSFMKPKVDKNTLIWLLTQATIFQAIFSGLLAGIMGEEDPYSGAKHIIVMLSIVLLAIMLLI